MSNVTIPQLPAAGALTGAELYVLAQGGIMSSVTGALLATWLATVIQGVPSGTLIHYSTTTPPSGYLACPIAQTNLSRTTYAALFNAIVLTQACTLTLATPGVVNLANHNRQVGDQVYFSTTGTLPTGLVAGTQYFVAPSPAPTTGTYSVAATVGGAAIAFTGAQTGIQSVTYAPWGIGDGTTTFGMPWFPAGYSLLQGATVNAGTQTVGAAIAHTHQVFAAAGGGGTLPGGSVIGSPAQQTTNVQTPTGAAANFAAGTSTLIAVKY